MFHKHYVYRHLTLDGRTLYIGIGNQGRAWEITKRDKYHKSQLLTFNHDYVELEATGLTRDEAILMERKLIRLEDPICNIQERR